MNIRKIVIQGCIYDSEVITGKQLFERVEKMLNGPESVDIFGKQLAGFINNSSNFTLNSNLSNTHRKNLAVDNI